MRYITEARFFAVMAAIAAIWSSCPGVTSILTRHSTAEDFQKGQTHGTVIGSDGTIKLGSATRQLWAAAEDDEIWSVNRMIAGHDGTIYAGTSPNGKILKFFSGKWTVMYPVEKPVDPNRVAEPNTPADPNAPVDPNTVKAEKEKEQTGGRHIYALAMDGAGKLLAAMSGKECKVMRFDGDKPVTIFEPNEASYIFAMAFDSRQNLYLATGPKGKLYKVNPDGKGKVLCNIKEKNILSLAVGSDTSLYAGSDEKGRVYKIDMLTGGISVLYDADEVEVAALALDDEGNLYAAISSEQAIKTSATATAGVVSAQPGRPPMVSSKGQSSSRELRMAHMPAQEQPAQEKPQPKPIRPIPPGAASVVYKITKAGYVTKVFSQPVVFFDMAMANGRLIAGTGNTAQLFGIDVKKEEQSELFSEKKASQITAVYPVGDDILIGTANGAKIIRILNKFSSEATFDSQLIDAGQPARWGKLHIDAQIPDGTSVLMSARSGNVSEVNDPTFSKWTPQVAVDEPVDLGCPVGRFCQYRLILKSDGKETPVVRVVAAASVVANLAPVVDAVTAGPAQASPLQKGRNGVMRISIKAHDDNKDTLTYKLEMRKLGRQRWIKIEDDLDKSDYEWDTKTVEDGRYELRAIASDRKSNTEVTAMEGTRISDPIIVDNTPPQAMEVTLSINATGITLGFKAVDELSIISGAEYAIDSSKDWVGTLPDDSVFDQTTEAFTIVAKKLDVGEHVIAVRITDAAGNVMYKTWDFTIGEGK